jgi:hypothetical protein
MVDLFRPAVLGRAELDQFSGKMETIAPSNGSKKSILSKNWRINYEDLSCWQLDRQSKKD